MSAWPTEGDRRGGVTGHPSCLPPRGLHSRPNCEASPLTIAMGWRFYTASDKILLPENNLLRSVPNSCSSYCWVFLKYMYKLETSTFYHSVNKHCTLHAGVQSPRGYVAGIPQTQARPHPARLESTHPMNHCSSLWVQFCVQPLAYYIFAFKY